MILPNLNQYLHLFAEVSDVVYFIDENYKFQFGNKRFYQFYNIDIDKQTLDTYSQIPDSGTLITTLKNISPKKHQVKIKRTLNIVNQLYEINSIINHLLDENFMQGFLIIEKIPEQNLANNKLEIKVNESLANASTELISPSLSINSIVKIIFKACFELTQCETGYIAFHDPLSEQILIHYFTEEFINSNKIANNIIFISRNDFVNKGIYGYPIDTQTHTIENHTLLRPKKNIGPNTPKLIRNFLSYPSIVKEVFMGQIVLINSNDGFSEQIQSAVKSLSNMYGLAIFRKRLEWDLVNAKERAEESDRLKSAFLANMSHEIRTPMNSIVGFGQLITSNTVSDSRKEEFYAMINSSCDDLLSIVNDIIDISKIEAGQLKIKPETVELHQILKEVHEWGIVKIQHKKKTFPLKLDIPRVNEFKLTIDRFRFRQVIQNLIDNAIKFTHEGELRFGYELIRKNWLRFYVKDTGIGIPANQLSLIFESFRQMESAISRNFGGTGLGLAISKKLIEQMGGTIGVESKEHVGSEFWFEIPVGNIELEIENPEPIIPIEQIDFRGKYILVVEDEPKNAQVLAYLLKQHHATVKTVYDGIAAIEICEQEYPDLILMDIRLPKLDGLEATKRIKQMQDIPIIAQTAYALKEDEAKCRAAGCDGYITKPISRDDLLHLVHSCLKGKC
jgi:signal transduction histidine kinase